MLRRFVSTPLVGYASPVTRKIISCSETPLDLSIKDNFLIVQDGHKVTKVFVEDVHCLILGHPRVSITANAIQKIISSGGTVLFSDEKHAPLGLVLPLVGNFEQTKRFQVQSDLSQSKKDKIWKQFIKAKILNQARVLQHYTGVDKGLSLMVKNLRTGDPANLEAQASRKYWKSLMGDQFRRDRDLEDENLLLNYGYTLIRSSVARAVVATGLHPSLGIHHHNKYSNFPLADDLMEPFRPFVDSLVVEIKNNGKDFSLNKENRSKLLGIFHKKCSLAKEDRIISDAIIRVSQSFCSLVIGESKSMEFPIWTS